MISRRPRFPHFLLALVAAVMLMAQGLVAPGAMAAPAKTIEICTSHGLKTVAAPDAPAAPKAPCPHCDSCVVAAIAAPAPELSPSVGRIAYVVTQAYGPASRTSVPYAARGPPRPPGQAPPQS